MAVDDSYTKLLLHLNGVDGSTTITDEAGKTVTANGNAQIDTAQKKFGTASLLLDGSGDYLTIPDSDDWRLDGGSNANQWTIDFWVRLAVGTNQNIISQGADANNRWVFFFSGTSLRFLVISGGTQIVDITNSWSPSTSTWYHIAVVKNGTSGYMVFVDGTQIGSTQTDTDVIPDYTGSLYVGSYPGATGNYLNGWIDEVRISKGIARWTANFTPPTAEYMPRFIPQVIWM